jgi:hypothetical protein
LKSHHALSTLLLTAFLGQTNKKYASQIGTRDYCAGSVPPVLKQTLKYRHPPPPCGCGWKGTDWLSRL